MISFCNDLVGRGAAGRQILYEVQSNTPSRMSSGYYNNIHCHIMPTTCHTQYWSVGIHFSASNEENDTVRGRLIFLLLLSGTARMCLLNFKTLFNFFRISCVNFVLYYFHPFSLDSRSSYNLHILPLMTSSLIISDIHIYTDIYIISIIYLYLSIPIWIDTQPIQSCLCAHVFRTGQL